MAKLKLKEWLNSPFILKLLDIGQTILAHDVVAMTGAALITIPLEDMANDRCQATGKHCETGGVISGIRTAIVAGIVARGAAPAIPALTELARAGAWGASQKPSLVQQVGQGPPWP
mgnify:CR=1 FL=1